MLCYVGKATKIFLVVVAALLIVGLTVGLVVSRHGSKKSSANGGECEDGRGCSSGRPFLSDPLPATAAPLVPASTSPPTGPNAPPTTVTSPPAPDGNPQPTPSAPGSTPPQQQDAPSPPNLPPEVSSSSPPPPQDLPAPPSPPAPPSDGSAAQPPAYTPPSPAAPSDSLPQPPSGTVAIRGSTVPAQGPAHG